MLVVDQGVLAGRVPSNKLYAIDIESLAITETVEVGLGAHGVAANGNRAYVTAIEDDSVSAVDLETWKVVAQVKVGRKPNGISVWSPDGGTP
jgi:YVTN family beta-propeller protein